MAKQANVPAPQQVNMIGEGTVIEGTLKATTDMHISGRVIGTVRVEGKVFLTQQGGIEGELIAANADVAGHVQGQIEIKERVMLKSTARVEGDVRAARLVMEEGALFNGQCLMGSKPEALKQRSLTAGKPGDAPPTPGKAMTG